MEPTAAAERTKRGTASGNGSAPAAETFDVLHPTDGSVLETVAVATPEQVAQTVARVRARSPHGRRSA